MLSCLPMAGWVGLCMVLCVMLSMTRSKRDNITSRPACWAGGMACILSFALTVVPAVGYPLLVCHAKERTKRKVSCETVSYTHLTLPTKA